jgi:phenylalanyl-tRNA synthetase beta chain
VPGLLRAIESNIRWRGAFRIFETGSVFLPGEWDSLDDGREKLPVQTKRIGAAFVGDDPEALFRDAKGVIDAIGARVHVAPVAATTSGSAPWADSGACLAIVSGGRTIGTLGVLSRRGTRAAGLKHAFAAIFEFDMMGLASSPSRDNRFVALPELPSVEVDVSLTYPDAIAWAEIAGAARGVSPLIAAIEFVDQYRGKGIPDGHRSITLRARLQPTTQTLTSEEAVAVANAIRVIAREQLGAIER